MLVSFTFYIVGLHILLLSHIAHTFVLLTANVEDVKKIARKFVSDSLAEKITNFILRATETMSNVENTEVSDETEVNDPPEPYQVSAENKMFNRYKYGSDSLAEDITKSKEDDGHGTEPSVEKRTPKFKDLGTTRKPRDDEPKPLQGKSLYIDREKKDSLATENDISKLSEEDKPEEPMTHAEGNYVSTPKDKTKTKQQKKNIKGKRYKLLSAFDTVEFNAAKGSIPDNLKRSKDDEIFAGRKADIEIDNEIQKKREDVGISERYHQSKKLEQDENEIITKTDKVKSLTLVTEVAGMEENWWKKVSPYQNHDEVNERKAWF